MGLETLSVTAADERDRTSSRSVWHSAVRSSWSYPWTPIEWPAARAQSMTSAVRPSKNSVPRMPTPSSESRIAARPLSEDEKRGASPEPLSRDPAATLPGTCTLTSRSMSAV